MYKRPPSKLWPPRVHPCMADFEIGDVEEDGLSKEGLKFAAMIKGIK